MTLYECHNQHSNLMTLDLVNLLFIDDQKALKFILPS